MFGLKRPQFTSKRDAYNKFIAYFFAPYLFAGFGIYFVIWWADFSSFITRDHAVRTIYLVVFISLVVLICSWYKAFYALYAIMGKDYDNLPDIPEHVICVSCREPLVGENIKELKCPSCGKPLENLKGFYERHPELLRESNEEILDEKKA